MSAKLSPTFPEHYVVFDPDGSCDNLPIEERQCGGSQPCRDAGGGAIRSPADSYSDSEIAIVAVPLSPEVANNCTCFIHAGHTDCCSAEGGKITDCSVITG